MRFSTRSDLDFFFFFFFFFFLETWKLPAGIIGADYPLRSII